MRQATLWPLVALIAACGTAVAACATAGEITRDELGRERLTLSEGDQRWVDDERLSVFLHSVDPALEIATVYLKPRDGEQETFSMDPESNRVVDFEAWRIELIELPGPDAATLAIGPNPAAGSGGPTN